MLKKEEELAIAGLVDSRTIFMLAGAACTGRFVVARALVWFAIFVL